MLRRTVSSFRRSCTGMPTSSTRATIRRKHTEATTRASSRIDKITAKLPRRWQKYAQGLRNAPVSHVLAFVLLHEITAVVPLVGLFALFHYTNWVPTNSVASYFQAYVERGMPFFERYFRRKEWFGFARDDQVSLTAGAEDAHYEKNSLGADKLELRQPAVTDRRYQVLVEAGLAYAIIKALLPIRIIGSIWATPWFARQLGRARTIFKRTPR